MSTEAITSSRRGWLLAMLPALFLAVFFGLPNALLLSVSFMESEAQQLTGRLTLANHTFLLTEWVYLRAPIRTILVGVSVGLIDVALAFPIAYFLVRTRTRWRGLPVWATGLSAVTGKRLFTHGDFCVPASCGGVAVHPGDAILADENGVLVLKPDEIPAAASRAVAMQTAEKTTLARVAAGEKIADINGTNQRVRDLMAEAAGR